MRFLYVMCILGALAAQDSRRDRTPAPTAMTASHVAAAGDDISTLRGVVPVAPADRPAAPVRTADDPGGWPPLPSPPPPARTALAETTPARR